MLFCMFDTTLPALGQTDATNSGTGFFINSDGWVVTNAHVMEGCRKVSVPQLGEGTDWVIDKQNDLAAIKVVGSAGKPFVPIRQLVPRLGEDIAAFGFPLAGVLSDSIKVTTGNINSLVGMENDTRFLQISTPLQPGNSGGPVVDQMGALVGVATAVLGSKFESATGITPQNVNFAVRSNILELFLQSHGIRYTDFAASDDAPLSTADVSERVVPAVVQVLCWSDTPEFAAAPQQSNPTPPTPAISAPLRQFRFLDNHDVIGFDYAALRAVSRSECQNACEADVSCRAITYNKKERFCFLKSDAKLIVRNGDAFANVAEELSSSVLISTFAVASGKDMAGGDYKRLRNSNFVGCYLACEGDVVCRAFAYVRKQKACWLKSAIGRVSKKTGVELGIK
jgi:hypothetical protein